MTPSPSVEPESAEFKEVRIGTKEQMTLHLQPQAAYLRSKGLDPDRPITYWDDPATGEWVLRQEVPAHD